MIIILLRIIFNIVEVTFVFLLCECVGSIILSVGAVVLVPEHYFYFFHVRCVFFIHSWIHQHVHTYKK